MAMQEPPASRPHAPAGYFGKDADRLLPWSHAQQRLEEARNYWLATVGPDGRPHVTPVWGLWLDGALCFGGAPTARWARHLAEQPSAAIHLESADDVVILEGEVEDIVADADAVDRIVAAWNAKYGHLAPDPAVSGLFRFSPRSARSWIGWSLRDGTRWRLS
ncbi:MAG: pyridoxamine 5'-phosphate oxidase family protein [Dehalococcoidia bacterium]